MDLELLWRSIKGEFESVILVNPRQGQRLVGGSLGASKSDVD